MHTQESAQLRKEGLTEGPGAQGGTSWLQSPSQAWDRGQRIVCWDPRTGQPGAKLPATVWRSCQSPVPFIIGTLVFGKHCMFCRRGFQGMRISSAGEGV